MDYGKSMEWKLGEYATDRYKKVEGSYLTGSN